MMSGFVIDASATLPWRFEAEATPWTEALLDRVQGGEDVRVPAHWPLEVVNTLLMARRRDRVTGDQVTVTQRRSNQPPMLHADFQGCGPILSAHTKFWLDTTISYCYICY